MVYLLFVIYSSYDIHSNLASFTVYYEGRYIILNNCTVEGVYPFMRLCEFDLGDFEFDTRDRYDFRHCNQIIIKHVTNQNWVQSIIIDSNHIHTIKITISFDVADILWSFDHCIHGSSCIRYSITQFSQFDNIILSVYAGFNVEQYDQLGVHLDRMLDGYVPIDMSGFVNDPKSFIFYQPCIVRSLLFVDRDEDIGLTGVDISSAYPYVISELLYTESITPIITRLTFMSLRRVRESCPYKIDVKLFTNSLIGKFISHGKTDRILNFHEVVLRRTSKLIQSIGIDLIQNGAIILYCYTDSIFFTTLKPISYQLLTKILSSTAPNAKFTIEKLHSFFCIKNNHYAYRYYDSHGLKSHIRGVALEQRSKFQTAFDSHLFPSARFDQPDTVYYHFRSYCAGLHGAPYPPNLEGYTGTSRLFKEHIIKSAPHTGVITTNSAIIAFRCFSTVSQTDNNIKACMFDTTISQELRKSHIIDFSDINVCSCGERLYI